MSYLIRFTSLCSVFTLTLLKSSRLPLTISEPVDELELLEVLLPVVGGVGRNPGNWILKKLAGSLIMVFRFLLAPLVGTQSIAHRYSITVSD